jgi:hypothetical protein
VFGNAESGTLLATAAADFINKVHGGKAEVLRLTFPDGGELGRERDKAVDETLAKAGARSHRGRAAEIHRHRLGTADHHVGAGGTSQREGRDRNQR